MKPSLGVCYYSEQWPETQWAEDAARMRHSGLSWVRVGEFAWSRLEPQPGAFDFAWLDRALDTLGQAGLQIILGTPSATPPRWLITQYPDMLAVDCHGQTRQFGSRRHYDFSHQGYRQAAARITGLMAERYAQHPQLGAWQVDNEYGCHDTMLSYSAAARAGFQAWLQARYLGIDALNQAWGNVFWSMEYGSFAEIELPNQTVTEANPAHWQDFRHYSSAQVVAFNQALVAAIRAHDSHTPITHNYMGRTLDFDHFAVGADLDLASWDSYPLGFLEDRSEDGAAWKQAFMRQGDPDFQALHHDLYRAVGRGRWWVMEQQPGPVNWAPYNPAPLPGMVRLWSWEALAHGAELVAYFRWRQAPFAQEQMHAGLLRPDNEAAAALAEVQQVAAEIQQHDDLSTQPASVAIIWDYESAWAWETQPQGKDFSYFRLVFEQYRALRRLGLSIDICPAHTTDLSAYALVLIPGLMHWPTALTQALQAYQGLVFIGPRAGSKTVDFQIPAHLPPNCPALLNLQVTQVESLRPDVSLPLSVGGHVQHWREYLQLNEPLEILASVEQQAVVVRQEQAIYCGAALDTTGYQNILEPLCQEAGLHTLRLPDGLRLRQLGAGVVALNYSDAAQDLRALTGYKFEQAELEAAGVCFGVRESI